MENGIWKNLPLWGDPGKSNLFCVRGWLLGKDGGVAESVEMVRTYGFDSQILVASVRHPLHVVQGIQAGAQIATMPLKILEMLFKHPLTDAGLKRFLDDWNAAGLHIL